MIYDRIKIFKAEKMFKLHIKVIVVDNRVRKIDKKIIR